MGIDWHTARALIGAHSTGVEFGSTATLGRQNLYISMQAIANIYREYGIAGGPTLDMLAERPEYADDLFKLLGANRYVPIDASAYEGAAEVHDMNTPIPDRLRKAFDVVVDGGTLEHVFNFPIAMKNAMEMVRTGGHLFLQTPTNNFCGHGFYQFSPELYYRVLTPDNGFQIVRMLAYESYPLSPWYEVADPALLGGRVELVGSRHRILLLVHARRTDDRIPLEHTPQQSDYAATWSGAQRNGSPPLRKFGIRRQPGLMHRAMWATLRLFGKTGRHVVASQQTRYQNRQLTLNDQPDAFRRVE